MLSPAYADHRSARVRAHNYGPQQPAVYHCLEDPNQPSKECRTGGDLYHASAYVNMHTLWHALAVFASFRRHGHGAGDRGGRAYVGRGVDRDAFKL